MNKRPTCARDAKGAIPTLIMAMLLMVAFMTISICVDIAHAANVREALQSATDAAALAGAGELMKSDPSALDVTFAETAAFNTLVLSNVEGTSLSPSGTSNQADCLRVLINTPIASHHQVRVTARRATRTVFSRLFSNTTNIIEASSVAEVAQGIFTLPAGQGLPLAVDVTVNGGNLYPLTAWNPRGAMHGQPFTIHIQSGKSDNSGWIAGAVPGPSLYEKDLSVGQTIFETNSSVDRQLDGIKVGETYIVPLTDNQYFSLPNADEFNMPHKIAGWMGFQVMEVTDHAMTGRIVVPVVVPGRPGAIVPSSEPSFTNWSAPWMVCLKERT